MFTRRAEPEGILAENVGNGNVTVSSTGNITTTGNQGQAIRAENKGDGVIHIVNRGNLTTRKNSSHGIIAAHRFTGGTKDIIIDSIGTITTAGTGSSGIRVVDFGSKGAIVTSVGNITTSGTGSSGIKVRETATGDTIISSTGDITTSGTGGFNALIGEIAGINVSSNKVLTGSASGGDVRITNRGNISTIGKQFSGITIFNEAGDGVIHVETVGAITTTGRKSRGIFVKNDGDHDTTILFDGSIAISGGDNLADGIAVEDGAGGNVSIASNGTISATSDGIRVFESGAGSVEVVSTNTIQTSASFGRGIIVTEGGAGDASVVSRAAITTTGMGIRVSGTGTGDVAVASSGAISTSGTFAAGISTSNLGDGNVSITSSGTIATTGEQAHGIVVVKKGFLPTPATGNTSVTSTSNIAVSGVDAVGIFVATGSAGNHVVTLSGGKVSGGSNDGAGVSFDSSEANATNTLNNAIMISALSGVAVQGSDGNETINNTGIISGMINLGGGADTLNLQSSGTFNHTADLGPGDDRYIFNTGFVPGNTIDGGADTDTISATIGTGQVLEFNIANRFTGFEILDKQGTGTLNLATTAFSAPILFMANAGLSQSMIDQPNLNVQVNPGARFVTNNLVGNVTTGVRDALKGSEPRETLPIMASWHRAIPLVQSLLWAILSLVQAAHWKSRLTQQTIQTS